MNYEDVKRIRHNPQSKDVDNKELGRLIDEAVEKQIPKKPDAINNRGITYWSCPTCSSLATDSITGLKYLHNCGVCGQRLDWER